MDRCPVARIASVTRPVRPVSRAATSVISAA